MTNVMNLGSFIVNTYLIESNGKAILIDTGYKEQFAAFYKRLKKHGLSINDIDYIFLTHAHDDHVGFINEILIGSEAKVILHSSGIKALLGGQNCSAGSCSGRRAQMFFSFMKLLGKGEHRFPPLPHVLGNRLMLIRPDTREEIESILGARIIDTPGHTSCSISLMTGDGLLFCGDAAMNGFPSSKRVSIWIENHEVFYKSWEKIINLRPKIIYPGHGKPFPASDLEQYLSSLHKKTLFPII